MKAFINLKHYRKWLFFLLPFLFMLAISYAYNKLTDGFSIGEITSSLGYDPQREIAVPSSLMQEELDKIFSQPFYYIGKGCQCYAFGSDDGKYIIKFFKHKHLRPLDWVNHLFIPPFLQDYVQTKIKKRAQRIASLFASCKLAYEELPYETGIIFLHLNRTPVINRTLTIYNKLNLKHKIDLNHHEFIIQKQGKSSRLVLEKLLKEKNEKQIKKHLRQLFEIVALRCEKGVRDCDPAVLQNVAFIASEKRAIFVDIGQFVEDRSLIEEGKKTEELQKRINTLRCWSETHMPDLIPFINEMD